jgi:hypothetical protein
MMAARRALSIRPTPNRHFCVAGNVHPHVNQVSAESAIGAAPDTNGEAGLAIFATLGGIQVSA